MHLGVCTNSYYGLLVALSWWRFHPCRQIIQFPSLGGNKMLVPTPRYAHDEFFPAWGILDQIIFKANPWKYIDSYVGYQKAIK